MIVLKSMTFFVQVLHSANKIFLLKGSIRVQVIKIFLGVKSNTHSTLITFEMYSSSLRFQQNESKNHSTSLTSLKEQKTVKGDQK